MITSRLLHWNRVRDPLELKEKFLFGGKNRKEIVTIQLHGV